MIRGNPRACQAANVSRRLLEALAGPVAPTYSGSGRLEMAKQLVDPSVSLSLHA